MEIEIDGCIYDIKWRHERLHKFIDNSREEEIVLPNGGRTVAYIFGADGSPIEAYSDCSEKDTYSKKLGRVISTGRLFKMLGLPTKEATKL